MSFIILESWNISAQRDEHYGMPILHRDHENGYFSVSPEVWFTCCPISRNLHPTTQDIYFIFNAQHDCKGGECNLIETCALQDKERTSRMKLAVKHSDGGCYVVNLHAHHNAWRLRKVLPRNLTAPVPYTSECQKLHAEAAGELQKKNPAKRAETAAKAKATRERNKEEVEE